MSSYDTLRDMKIIERRVVPASRRGRVVINNRDLENHEISTIWYYVGNGLEEIQKYAKIKVMRATWF